MSDSRSENQQEIVPMGSKTVLVFLPDFLLADCAGAQRANKFAS
jgi:hypothetical protein